MERNSSEKVLSIVVAADIHKWRRATDRRELRKEYETPSSQGSLSISSETSAFSSDSVRHHSFIHTSSSRPSSCGKIIASSDLVRVLVSCSFVATRNEEVLRS